MLQETDSISPGFLPYTKAKLIKVKDNLIINEIGKAERRMHDTNGEQNKMSNAVDHMLHREAEQAAKKGRKPQYYSRAMIAEVRISGVHDALLELMMSRFSVFSSLATTPPQPH